MKFPCCTRSSFWQNVGWLQGKSVGSEEGEMIEKGRLNMHKRKKWALEIKFEICISLAALWRTEELRTVVCGRATYLQCSWAFGCKQSRGEPHTASTEHWTSYKSRIKLQFLPYRKQSAPIIQTSGFMLFRKPVTSLFENNTCIEGRRLLSVGNTLTFFTFKSLPVSFHTTRFKIKKFYMVFALRWVFCVDIGTDSDFCFIHHYVIGFYSRGGKCLLRGTDWFLI